MDDLWSELERLTSLCERTGAEMAVAGGVAIARRLLPSASISLCQQSADISLHRQSAFTSLSQPTISSLRHQVITSRLLPAAHTSQWRQSVDTSLRQRELDRLQERLREREIQLGELREQLHAVRRLQMAEPPPPDEVRVSHHQPEHDRRAGSLPGRPAPPPRPAEALFNQLVQNRYQSDTLPGQPVSLRSSERDARAMSSSLSHFGSKSSLAQSLTGSSKSAESHKAFDNYYEMSNADDKCSLEETALNKHGFGTQQQQQNSSEKSRKSKTNMIRMRGTGCKQKTSTMRQMLNKVFGTKQAKKATYNLSSSPIQKTRSETGLFRGGEQPRGCSTPLAASGAAPRSFSLQNLASSGSAGRLSYLHSSHEEVYEDVTDSEWECATEDEQDGSPIYINMEFHNGCLVPKANKLIGPKMK
ncbi:hypothetical protein FJT64_017292 [Amphibalanus amphitrite]|uniref:Uncharacterized protein n=1 Tax=Amphibalanus amphitrite TaxID=1232801 RepID=A0A6A4X7A0_AMPAM|nr:hypothetical protein FJT64_017292 [Amphibalanus amphitrite]